ncbi:MmyB family transcriptional regulator, partial [Streptomyces sp. NPDC054838]
MLARLEARSPEYRELWARHEVVGPAGKTKFIRNEHVGLPHVEHTN